MTGAMVDSFWGLGVVVVICTGVVGFMLEAAFTRLIRELQEEVRRLKDEVRRLSGDVVKNGRDWGG